MFCSHFFTPRYRKINQGKDRYNRVCCGKIIAKKNEYNNIN